MSEMDTPARTAFANAVLSTWDGCMEKFFEAVDDERETRGFTTVQASQMLAHSYGYDVSDQWDDWFAEDAR